MTAPTLTCPTCRTEIKLTESLAAPLIVAAAKRPPMVTEERLQAELNARARNSTLSSTACGRCLWRASSRLLTALIKIFGWFGLWQEDKGDDCGGKRRAAHR
jgi:hypothetical protein